MTINILNQNGENTGRSVDLPSNIFGIEPNEHVLYLAVKQYLAHQRQGTHKTKERSEKAGSTRKLKKQKGTGGARAGSMKSPVFIGGGRVFGPRPRDYYFKLNKKVKLLARKSVLSAKAQAGLITVIEDFTFDAPRTKSYLSFLGDFSLSNTKTLLITSTSEDKSLYLSGRNIPKTNIIPANQINTYDLMNTERLLIAEGAITEIESMFN